MGISLVKTEVRDWVTEEEGNASLQLIHTYGCALIGRNTYNSDREFYSSVGDDTYFIWTTHPELNATKTGVVYVSGSPTDVLNYIAGKGFAITLLAGVSFTNSAFLSAGLVNEIYASVYPLILGEGIKIVNGSCPVKLQLIGTKSLHHGIMQLHYTVHKLTA